MDQDISPSLSQTLASSSEVTPMLRIQRDDAGGDCRRDNLMHRGRRMLAPALRDIARTMRLGHQDRQNVHQPTPVPPAYTLVYRVDDRASTLRASARPPHRSTTMTWSPIPNLLDRVWSLPEALPAQMRRGSKCRAMSKDKRTTKARRLVRQKDLRAARQVTIPIVSPSPVLATREIR